MESVRVHTARSMLSDSSYLALQNSLAGFQRELWEDYHLFLVDIREAGGVEGLQKEMQKNLDRSWRTGVLAGPDWMGVTCSVEEVIPERFLLTDKGAELEEQVLSYMKYRGIFRTGEMLLEQMGMMESFLKGEELFEKKLELERSFGALEERKGEIAELVCQMEESRLQAEMALSSLSQKTEDEDCLAELDTIHRVAGNLAGASGQLRNQCGNYLVEFEKADSQKEAYGSWLSEQEGIMEEHAWQTLQEDLEELTEWQGKDAGYVERTGAATGRNEVLLGQLQEICGGETPPAEMAAVLADVMG